MSSSTGAAKLSIVIALTLAPALARAQDSLVAVDTTIIRAPIRVCAGGDVTLGTNLDTVWMRRGAARLRAAHGVSGDPASLLAPLRPLFADADIVLVNVETAIGLGPTRTKCGPRSKNCYAFRSPPSAGAALRTLGRADAFVVANVANNHARDAGDIGVDSTIANLRRATVLVTGADTLATPVILRGGVTVGILGFYAGDMVNDARNIAAVQRHVARAVEQYGTVVVTAHIGAEGIDWQRVGDSTEFFLESRIDRGNPVAFGRAALDAGAAFMVGHGPHVLRAAEWRGQRLALYSLGNLVTYGPFNNAEPINRGAIACVDVAPGGVVGADLRPTVQIAPGVVMQDLSRRALLLIDSLSVLDFPETGVRVDQWGELRRTTTVRDSTSSPLRQQGRGARRPAGGSAPKARGPSS